MVLSVQNNGDRAAEDVDVQCDYKGFAEIKRLNEPTEMVPFDRRLEIGRIKIREPVTIHVWTNDVGVSPEGTVTLTHSLGEQAVRFPAKGAGNAIAFWKRVSLILAVVAICAFLFGAYCTRLLIGIYHEAKYIHREGTKMMNKMERIVQRGHDLEPAFAHLEKIAAEADKPPIAEPPSGQGN